MASAARNTKRMLGNYSQNVTIGDTAIGISKDPIFQKLLFVAFRDLCGRVAIFLMLTRSIDTDT